MALVSDAGTPLRRRSRLPAGRRGDRRRPSGDGGAGRLGAAGGAGGRGAADRPLPVRGLPRRRAQAARRRALAELAAVPATLVFYESPRRLAASLADMADGRSATAARRGLPRADQALRGGPPRPLGELAAHYAAAPEPKGEIVVRRRPARSAAPPRADALDAALGGGARRAGRCRTPRPRSPRRSACRAGRSMPGRWSWRGADSR